MSIGIGLFGLPIYRKYYIVCIFQLYQYTKISDIYMQNFFMYGTIYNMSGHAVSADTNLSRRQA